MSNLQKLIQKERLPPPGFSDRFNKSGVSNNVRGKKDYNPTMWNKYFEEKNDICINEKDVFRVYRTKMPTEEGPLLVLLHGGGYSALTWSLFSVEICNLVHCQCLSIDLRGHGDSNTEDEDDLSAETLAIDVGKIISKLYPDKCPPILLIGHSMGGAIAVHVASMELIPTLIGVTVIDVVEGTALEALASMQSFLRSRPTHFKSITHAIEWCIRSGQVRNLESVKVSMPGQIINCETKKLATNELPLKIDEENDNKDEHSKFVHPFSLSEVPETNDEENASSQNETVNFKIPSHDEQIKRYTWRIDLSKSEKFWVGWFKGLSEKFLNLRVPKLLLLANIDGLDRTLTVGQMQGKFQMQVLSKCGHSVHEDRPHEVAEVIGSFLLRNKFAQPASDFSYRMPAC